MPGPRSRPPIRVTVRPGVRHRTPGPRRASSLFPHQHGTGHGRAGPQNGKKPPVPAATLPITMPSAQTGLGGDVAGRRRAPITGDGPRAQLALRLRALRDATGLTLREVAARSGYSAAALSNAERGRHVPSWGLVESFVGACGADPAQWRQLWEIARDDATPAKDTAEAAMPTESEFEPTTGPTTGPAGDAPPAEPAPSGTGDTPVRRRWKWTGIAAAVAVLILVGGILLTHANPPTAAAKKLSGTPSAAVAAPSKTPGTSPAPVAEDGRDPYEAGCAADQKQLDWQTVRWADGKTYGTVILKYSRACHAAWGYVQGPVSHRWTVHTDAHRDPDGAVAPAAYSGDQTLPGSWGNVLSTRNGCVYVVAWVDTPKAHGPHARTACIRP